jgi:branched-chain amino acid transport system permease protein
MDGYLVAVLSNVGMLAFLGLSAYLLLLLGQISFGQQAFFALGAYASGVATAVWGWSLAAALVLGAGVSASAAGLLALATARRRGLYFSIATLAFAELVRIAFELWHYQVEINGERMGPDGAGGFRQIRWVFDHGLTPQAYLALIWGLLAVVLAFFFLLERSRLGALFRMLGEDEVAAELLGVHPAPYKVLAGALAGAIAALGGGLYAHLTTYLEPRIFDVMLGVHGLAYALIGGLGTALGPLIGVGIDVGLLESLRWLSGYRMIAFGGLVAVLLILRPRGLLDEALLHRLRFRRREG